MANPKGINPANSGDRKARAIEANVHRLDRSPSLANERAGTAEAEMPRPEERKPEAVPREEPHRSQPAANTAAPKKSLRRPLMFALLPVALILGGYFYVTGGAVMSTDNAYVQADMVGLSTDVAGIVTQVLVHDNQKVAKGDILFKLDPLQFQLALDRAESQVGNTRNDLVALRPATATCRPRSSRHRRMLTSTWSTSSARSNCSPTTLLRRPPSMPPATPCKGRSKSSPRCNNSRPASPPT
jgi:membrane fusion protein (multidrug efflux system)